MSISDIRGISVSPIIMGTGRRIAENRRILETISAISVRLDVYPVQPVEEWNNLAVSGGELSYIREKVFGVYFDGFQS